MVAAFPGWILFDKSDGQYYRIVAWVCSQDGDAVSPVVIDKNGSVGIVPVHDGSHSVHYDVATFEKL